MKKFLILFVLSLFVLNADAAMKYADAVKVNDKKPMAILIYADWAEGKDSALAKFRSLPQIVGSGYNYVEMDIASEDAKLYNETYVILPKLPYIMLYRSGGKFIRQLDRGCINDTSCINSKMKQFLR